MRELLSRVAVIAALSAAGEALLPEGRFHGVSRLLCGLYVIFLTAHALLGIPDTDLSQASWEYSPTEMSAGAAQKEQAAKVLVEEERLLSEYLKSHYGVSAGVRVDGEGRVTGIVTSGEVDAATRAAIAADMGVGEENISCGK